MKIKLVMNDWYIAAQNKTVREVDVEQEIELTLGHFHSGTTFDGTIELDEGDEKELRRALKQGHEPRFYIIEDDD